LLTNYSGLELPQAGFESGSVTAAGVKEVLANEVADEKRSVGKTQSPSQRNGGSAAPKSAVKRGFWHSSGTVMAERGGFGFWNGGKYFRMNGATAVGV
jgi:hypothetical protein